MPKIRKRVAKKLIENNRSITHYFGTPKNGNVSEIRLDEDSSEIADAATEFYKAHLEAKVKECTPKKNCHEIKKKLENQLALAKHKLEKINKANSICSDIIEKKNDEIELLEAKIRSQMRENLDTATSSPPKALSPPNASSPLKKILFENFESLSEEQLSKLRSIDKTQSADSTFILNSVRFFYSDNLAYLKGKSVKGISKSRPTQAMSPDKLDKMKLLYKERLSDMKLPDVEKVHRENQFNRHIHRAITNINAKTNKDIVKLAINMNN